MDFLKMYNQTVKADDLKNKDVLLEPKASKGGINLAKPSLTVPPKVYPAVMDRERLPVIPYLTIPDCQAGLGPRLLTRSGCQCQNETIKPVEELNFSKKNNYLKYLVLLGLVLIPFIVKK